MDLQRTAGGELTRADTERIGAALDASITPNTARAYRAALASYRRFLAGREANDETTAAYVAAMMEDGKAPATIRLHAAAIGAGARAAGETDPRGPLTRQALKGAVRRNAGRGRGQVAGLRREDALAAAAAAAAEGTTAGLRDAALLRVMSDALLRVSEVARVETGEIAREPDGSGRLALPRSKTDQEAEGAVAYLTPATVTALDRWLRAAAAAWTSSGAGERGYEGAVWRRVTRSGAVTGDKPLTVNAVRAIVRRRAEAVGVDGASGHSCRVGSAQSLIERGASTAAVAIAGRWKDPAMVVRYAKAQEAGRGAVKQYFGGK